MSGETSFRQGSWTAATMMSTQEEMLGQVPNGRIGARRWRTLCNSDPVELDTGLMWWLNRWNTRNSMATDALHCHTDGQNPLLLSCPDAR